MSVSILLLVILLGYGVLWWLTDSTTHNRQLFKWLRISYLLRALLAIVLFEISYYHWPILRSLQLTGGFWTFGIDAQVYHYAGGAMATAWRRHTTPLILPEPRQFLFSFIVAVIYWLCGVHPFYPLVLNAWCGAVCGLLAYLIAGRCVDQQAQLKSAVLVGFWPSSFMWTSQLLKDSLTWCLILTALFLSAVWCQSSSVRENNGRQRTLTWLGLMVVVSLMTNLRYYLGYALLLASSFVFISVTLQAALRRHFRLEWRLVSLVLTLILAVAFPSAWSMIRLKLGSLHMTGVPTPPRLITGHPLSPPVNIGRHAPVSSTPEGPALVHSSSGSSLPPTPQDVGATPARDATALFKVTSREALLRIRQGFVSTGGHSLEDRDVDISSPAALWWHLPKGLMVVLLAPFPNRWFDVSGSTGVMPRYAIIEMLLLYGLLLLSVISGLRSVISGPPPNVVPRSRDRGRLLLIVFTFFLMSTMALTVINVGTLFRLRLLFLFPLLTLISGTRWQELLHSVSPRLVRKVVS